MSYLAARVGWNKAMENQKRKASGLEPSAERKRRGAFFTPPEVAEFLTRWAIRSAADLVLEPSCGEAAFLKPAVARLSELGASPGAISGQIFGVDVHEASLEVASKSLKLEGIRPTLIADSFFSLDPPGGLLPSPIASVDAVVGNPPFIRYQQFSGRERAKAQAAALRQGVSLSGLASSWAALLVHAAAFLHPDGRLAMVLPAELLTVNYSEAVRKFLLERFAAVHVVHFKRLVFKDALEDVVLLLGEGSGGSSSLSFHLLENERELASFNPRLRRQTAFEPQGSKWTELLLPENVRRLIRDVTSEWFVSIGDYGSLQLGTVTGANDFFALRPTQVRDLKLTEPDVTRISPPGTRHLKGLRFTNTDWRSLADADERVWLLTLKGQTSKEKPVSNLIREGEESELHLRYKCRIRDPWYVVPPVAKPDLFFTYMSHRFPRLIRNVAGAGFLNSMHGVELSDDRRIGGATLPFAAMNSLSQLGAETIGRSYGGGILKLEPREASQLPVPRPDLLERLHRNGRLRFDGLDRSFRRGGWQLVQDFADEAVLMELAGLSTCDIEKIRAAVEQLRGKRLGRNRSK